MSRPPPLPSLFLSRQQRPPPPPPLFPPPRTISAPEMRARASTRDGQRTQPVTPSPTTTAATTTTATRKKRSRKGSDDLPNARKPSYQLQREEREELANEARALEELVEALRRRAGLPTKEDRAAVRHVRTNNFDLQESLHVNDLYLGRIQSMITKELLAPTISPMSTYIHLPQGMAQRRAILRGMQDVKLRRGIEVAVETLRHLDHTMPYLSEERFTTETGEFHHLRFEINQFPNFKTARQLYDVYVKFLYSLEISVTDMLGQFTLREDTEDFDPTIWNHHFVTVADDVGCTEELNIVGFAQFYNHSPYTSSPMGVIVYDTVNADDLHPYIPEERTCKDCQTANMIFELRKPGTDETIVVLKHIAYVVQLPPKFPLAPEALKQLQDNISRWPNAIMKYLREYVVTEEDSPSETSN